MAKKQRVNWTFTPEELRQANRLSELHGKSISEIVGQAISEKFQRETGEKPMSVKTIDVKFHESELTEHGGMLIDAAKQQSNFLNSILSTDADGYIYATLWDNDGLGLDDTVSIAVRSVLTRSERMRKYGLEACPPEHAERDENGELTYRRGPQGDFIPSEKYVSGIVKFYGDEHESRRWEIPNEIIRDIRRGVLAGASAINQAGEKLAEYLRDGQFEISE